MTISVAVLFLLLCVGTFGLEKRRERCVFLPEEGECKMNSLQYYYDADKQECFQFVYSGCGGNDNRFTSALDCILMCREVGKTAAERRLIGQLRTTYSHAKAEAEQAAEIPGDAEELTEVRAEVASLYKNLKEDGGKLREEVGQKAEDTGAVSATAVSSDAVPESKQSRCFEPKLVGPCRAYIPKYYYTQITKTCERFHYGGCKGNGNQFRSELECENICMTDENPEGLPSGIEGRIDVASKTAAEDAGKISVVNQEKAQEVPETLVEKTETGLLVTDSSPSSNVGGVVPSGSKYPVDADSSSLSALGEPAPESGLRVPGSQPASGISASASPNKEPEAAKTENERSSVQSAVDLIKAQETWPVKDGETEAPAGEPLLTGGAVPREVVSHTTKAPVGKVGVADAEDDSAVTIVEDSYETEDIEEEQGEAEMVPGSQGKVQGTVDDVDQAVSEEGAHTGSRTTASPLGNGVDNENEEKGTSEMSETDTEERVGTGLSPAEAAQAVAAGEDEVWKKNGKPRSEEAESRLGGGADKDVTERTTMNAIEEVKLSHGGRLTNEKSAEVSNSGPKTDQEKPMEVGITYKPVNGHGNDDWGAFERGMPVAQAHKEHDYTDSASLQYLCSALLVLAIFA